MQTNFTVSKAFLWKTKEINLKRINRNLRKNTVMLFIDTENNAMVSLARKKETLIATRKG